MKQKYEAPEMAIVEIELQQFLASSGFLEGGTGDLGTGDGYVDDDDIL